MREVFSGSVINAGSRYNVVTEIDGVVETRHCYAALTWRIPETDTRFFVHGK